MASLKEPYSNHRKIRDWSNKWTIRLSFRSLTNSGSRTLNRSRLSTKRLNTLSSCRFASVNSSSTWVDWTVSTRFLPSMSIPLRPKKAFSWHSKLGSKPKNCHGKLSSRNMVTRLSSSGTSGKLWRFSLKGRLEARKLFKHLGKYSSLSTLKWALQSSTKSLYPTIGLI